MPDRYYIDTMGCQMNERDSETIAGVLEGLGLVATQSPDDARVAVLNTCAVREKPEHKVFSRLGELARLKQRRPEMVIAVCGCMAQVGVDEIRKRAPYVDVILGPRNLKALGEAVKQALSAPCVTVSTDVAECPDEGLPAARTPGLSAFVNITYGCDNFCAYCIVPYTRGREISRPADDILAEVRGLIADGYREVTLLGQNVNSYHSPSESATVACRSAHQSAIGPSITFAQLLRLVGAVDGLWRLRFTTSHPKDLSEDLLRAIAETPAACEHLHLPIQAGDDVVLQRMCRRYTYAHYKALVDRAREIVPEISVTTDVMAGFPGETEEQFNNTMRAFEEIRFDQAFMFKYSDRPGTRAAKMSDKVPEKVKQQRLQRLVDLQNHVAREINQGQLGQVFEVLVEGRDEKSPEKMRGRTRQNKLMIFPGDENLIGKLVNVRAEEAYLWGFVGGSES
ncbi:MAG: tRNA (N6-isopentenyl adenosine(37)-C2)-methylthiotransferase MiaB [Armatimonadia bacterium]